ncbi:MAG: transposase [Verrucomicrobiaceae bacterium]|nr:transposase [Verrucomicrobiaceae bacterium]
MREWIAQRGFETPYVEPGSPWQNACSESFNARLRDELLNIECFGTLAEAKVLGKEYRHGYDEHRPHSSLNCQTPHGVRAALFFWLIPLRSISQKATHLPQANPTPKQSRQPPQDSHRKWIKFRGHLRSESCLKAQEPAAHEAASKG